MRRLEQAAEEARSRPVKAGIQETMSGSLMTARSRRHRIACPARWSFPQSGNGLYKPLDSSLRWNDTGGVDSVLACLCNRPECRNCKNDKASRLPGYVYSLIVIPAKAGIQETKPGSQCRPELADARLRGLLSGHSRTARMDDINHWIPAFAGMTARVNLVLTCLCKQARMQRL